jgi:serine/threonine protein kinase
MGDDPEPIKNKSCITCSNKFGGDLTLCPHDGTRLVSLNEENLVGTVLDDRYEMQEVLGGGGMGLVYKARHRLMNRTVAIKVLHKHMVSSPDALKRFRLEAEAVSCLNAPNILTVYDFGISNQGQPYMVMDYLAGVSLQDVLEAETHLDVQRSLDIFLQVCLALKHAHEKNIIHRDLKPSNIMLVNADGRSDFVKIVDFGIAKLLGRMDGELGNLTRTGEVFGSPLFMSPEQCRGMPLDPRTDIYSFGSVMYLTLSGKPLFEGDNVLDTFFKQSTQAPEPFSVICPELAIPPEIEAVVFKSLEKDPFARFQSMAELKAKLENVKEKLSGTQLARSTVPEEGDTLLKSQTSQNIVGSTESGAEQLATGPAIEANTSSKQVPLPRVGKRKAAVIAGCALGLLILILGSFFLGRNDGIEQEDKQNVSTGQKLMESGTPVIIKQSLKPSETAVPPINNVDASKGASLVTEKEAKAPAPGEANLLEANRAAERNKSTASHHRARSANTYTHHSLIGKAIHLIKKAL